MMKLVVICCVVAVAAARAPIYFGPAGFPLASSAGYAVPVQQELYNYRSPLSLAPGQPANIVAAGGRPVNTLNANLDRSGNFVAQAFDNGFRVLKKRSVTRLDVAPGPAGFSAAVAAGKIDISAPIAVSPTGFTATIATNPSSLSTPLAPGSFRTFSITNPFAAGPIGLSTAVASRPLGVAVPVTAGTIAVSPVAPGSIAASNTPVVRSF